MNETNSHLPLCRVETDCLYQLHLKRWQKVLKSLEEQAQCVQKWQELHLSFLKNCKTL